MHTLCIHCSTHLHDTTNTLICTAFIFKNLKKNDLLIQTIRAKA